MLDSTTHYETKLTTAVRGDTLDVHQATIAVDDSHRYDWSIKYAPEGFPQHTPGRGLVALRHGKTFPINMDGSVEVLRDRGQFTVVIN